MDIKIGEKVISIDDEQLKESLEKGTSIEIESDLIIKTKEEQDIYIDNLKPKIINTAMEMKVKELRDAKGLELEAGKKSFDGLFEAYESKLKGDLTREPNEQLEAKEKDIQLLQTTISSLEQEKNSLNSQFSEFKNTQLINSTLERHIPSNSLLDKDDMLMILKNKVNPTVDENGRVVFKKDGEIMKDTTTLSPFGADKVLENFFSENKNYLKGVSGGAGGGDSTTKHKEKSIDAFNESYKTIGDVGSMEYNKALNDAVINGDVVI